MFSSPSLPAKLRAALGGIALLLGLFGRFIPVAWLATAFAWPPFAALLVGLGGLVAVLAGLELTKGTAEPIGPEPSRSGWWLDVTIVVAMWAVSLTAYFAFIEHANPDRILSGSDWNVYANNTVAAYRGDWATYNVDKFAFHARFAAFLNGRGELAQTLIRISVVSASLRPVLTYLLARVAGGRWTALVAAILTFCMPMAWFFATQSNCYPFFSALVTAALISVLWAVHRPGLDTAILAGLLCGAAASTQEKAIVALVPPLLLKLAIRAPELWDTVQAGGIKSIWRPIVRAAVAITLFVGVQEWSAPPRPYTPLVNLVTIQRGEVHRDTTYDWPAVETPDVSDPAGIRGILPRDYWNGPIEFWLAAALTPTDANGLRFIEAGANRKAEWVVVPDTTIPPADVMIAKNLPILAKRFSGVAEVGVVMLVIGVFGMFAARGSRERRAVVLVAALLSGLAPLTLKYSSRYFVHLLPILATLSVVGTDNLLKRGLPGRWLVAGRGMMAVFWTLFAICAMNGEADSWKAPHLTFPPLASLKRDEREDYALNLKRVATWLAANPHPGPIVDCVPGGLVMVLFHLPEVKHTEGVAKCRSGIRHAQAGDWLAASAYPGFIIEHVPSGRELLASGCWRVVYGWEAPLTELVGEWHPRWEGGAMDVNDAKGGVGELVAGSTQFGDSAVVILEALVGESSPPPGNAPQPVAPTPAPG